MPAKTLRIIALIIIAIALLAMLLLLFAYRLGGDISFMLGLNLLLLCVGVFYYFSADKFGKKAVDVSRETDDEES